MPHELLLLANSEAANLATAVVVVLLSAVAYFFPTMVALARRVPHLGSVVVVNLFLGWTCIGWVVALAMAARSTDRRVVAN